VSGIRSHKMNREGGWGDGLGGGGALFDLHVLNKSIDDVGRVVGA
jgi:hypothetical protein